MCVDCTNTKRISIIYIEIGTGAYTKCAFGMLVVGGCREGGRGSGLKPMT